MKQAKQVLMSLAICLAGGGFAHVIRAQLAHAPSQMFKEYTIIKSERSESRSPYPMERSAVEAQRADGSRASTDIGLGNPTRYVWSVPDRMRVTINESLRAKTTFYYRDLPAPRPAEPDPQCGFSKLSAAANPILQGEARVLGFRTVVARTEHRMNNGESYLNTAWKAPDLDCAVLKMSEDRRDSSGNVTGHFEMQVSKVLFGPPDPKLFEIPADYTELSPSRLYDAHSAKLGASAKRPPDSLRRRLEREDKLYFANRQRE